LANLRNLSYDLLSVWELLNLIVTLLTSFGFIRVLGTFTCWIANLLVLVKEYEFRSIFEFFYIVIQPRVIDNGIDIKSVGRIELDHSDEQVFEFLAQVLSEVSPIFAEFSLTEHSKEVIVLLWAAPRSKTSDHNEKNSSKRENNSLIAVISTSLLKYFRSNIEWTSEKT